VQKAAQTKKKGYVGGGIDLGGSGGGGGVPPKKKKKRPQGKNLKRGPLFINGKG